MTRKSGFSLRMSVNMIIIELKSFKLGVTALMMLVLSKAIGFRTKRTRVCL